MRKSRALQGIFFERVRVLDKKTRDGNGGKRGVQENFFLVMTIERVEFEALFCMHSWRGSIATYHVEYRVKFGHGSPAFY